MTIERLGWVTENWGAHPRSGWLWRSRTACLGRWSDSPRASLTTSTQWTGIGWGPLEPDSWPLGIPHHSQGEAPLKLSGQRRCPSTVATCKVILTSPSSSFGSGC